jgi:transcriptional regulator with XRE-family HTH domain
MPGRANDLIVIPASFWDRPEVTTALRDRNMGRFFALVQQYTGASQTQIGMACGWSQGKISDIERGASEVKHLAKFEEIADGLNLPDPARIILGLAPRKPSRPPSGRESHQHGIPQRDTSLALQSLPPSSLLNLNAGDEQEDDDQVRRRNFVGLTGAAMLNAVLADTPCDAPPLTVEPFAPVLAMPPGNSPSEALHEAPDIDSLTAAVATVWGQFSAGRYSDLAKTLPSLLARLNAACLALDDEPQSRAFTLCAEAHRVAALVLLKLDDQGLAYLAADRSMRAAEASGDPVTVGASATTITATLMSSGHFPTAITAASAYAERLDHDMSAHTPESLSVYGAVLLRGAEAAARAGKRETASELLGEADETARRLGVDGNLRNTSFGPTNAKLYRVNLTVALGDAGSAVDTARKVDPGMIPTTERKATFLVDTARAFLQWGKHANACIALRAAEETAHEEVAGRPSVHQVVRDLVTSAPPSVRRDAEQLATQIGVAR